MRHCPRPRLADRGPCSTRGLSRGAPKLERLEPRALLAAVAWDGEAMDGDWHNPLNWAGDVLPGEGDDVTIAASPIHFVRISSPDTVRIASLDADIPFFTILSDFEVTERTTFGDVALSIVDADVSTANLTIAAGAAPVSNTGTWTISGESTIAKTIETSWSLLFADRSTVAFLPGVGDDFGRIDATGGTLSFGAQSLVDGLGPGFEHLRVGRRLQMDRGAIVQDAGIVVAGKSAASWEQAYLQGFGDLGAAFVNVSLDLDWASVRGVVTVSDSSLVARNGINWSARSHIEGGSLHVRGGLSGGNLRLRGLTITLGDDTIEGSASLGWRNLSIERSTVILTELSYVYGSISDTTITGPFNMHAQTLAGCIVAADATVIVSESITQSPDAWASYLFALIGERALDIYGRVIVAGGRVDWLGGNIRLLSADARLSTSATGYLVSNGGSIAGLGQVINAGAIESAQGVTSIDADILNTGTLRALKRFIVRDLSSPGNVEARGDTFTILGGLAQLVEGALTAGTWWAAAGGTINFPNLSIVRNDATIIVEGDSVMAAFRDLARNNGTIRLLGAGDWITGGTSPIDLVNHGTIRKEGARSRTIVGDIRQTPRGVLEIKSGRLLLEGSLDNAGIVRIGSEPSHSAPTGVRLRLTGYYNQRAAGVLTFLGQTGGAAQDYPRLIADQATLRGILLVDFARAQGGGTPVDQLVTLIVAQQPRVGTFASADLSVDPGTGVLKYTATGVRVRLVP